MLCFECGKPAEHNHHVVPRVRGGIKTVPLCVLCHEKAHGCKLGRSQLIKDGQAAARARGVKWGGQSRSRGSTDRSKGKTDMGSPRLRLLSL